VSDLGGFGLIKGIFEGVYVPVLEYEMMSRRTPTYRDIVCGDD
jgi:hypothetical protein